MILINLEILLKLYHASEFNVNDIQSTRVSELLNLGRHNFETDGLLHQSQINSSKKMNSFCHQQGKMKFWYYIQLLEKFQVSLEQLNK